MCSGSVFFNSGISGCSHTSVQFLLLVRSRRPTSTFGTLKWLTLYTSPRDVIDTLAFLIIAFSLWRRLPNRSLGMTTLGSTILRDATLYFIIIFLLQFFALVFLFNDPVGGR